MDAEQRSQEILHTLEAREAPDGQTVAEVKEIPFEARPVHESEFELRPRQQPQIAQAEPITEPAEEPFEEPFKQSTEERIKEPIEEASQGVMNAYFEEPVVEEPLVEEPFIEEPFEKRPFAPATKQLLANEANETSGSDDDEFFQEASAPNKTGLVTNVPPAVAILEKREEIETPHPIPPMPSQPSVAKPKWFTDLRAVNTIDVREAVQIPPVAEGDSANILQPHDQANAFLSQRPAVNFSTAYWAPWRADRDSYPFCHYPLYFEDPNLERCGRGWSCFTTFVSIGRFYANVPFIPYRITAEPHLSRIRTLPDCPAGHQFGWDVYLPPWSWKAAAVQAAAYAGAFYIVP